MDQKLVSSQDGSHTLFSEKYQAHYHSIYGALDESIHVFIASGLYQKINKGYKTIDVFEMGFGTGLNAYLSYQTSISHNVKVNYTGIETDPVSEEIISNLNYFPEDTRYIDMHRSKWNVCHLVDPHFTCTKLHKDIRDHQFVQTYDVIYYDAFAPECQHFLWQADIHKKIYNALNPYGILVTYCAKGEFKRTLKSLGYKVESLNGPGKKREMVRAIKSY